MLLAVAQWQRRRRGAVAAGAGAAAIMVAAGRDLAVRLPCRAARSGHGVVLVTV